MLYGIIMLIVFAFHYLFSVADPMWYTKLASGSF